MHISAKRVGYGIAAALGFSPACAPAIAAPEAESALMEQITQSSAAFSPVGDVATSPIMADIGQITTRYGSFGLASAFADALSLQVDRAALNGGYVSHRIDNFGNVAQVVQIAQVPSGATDSNESMELALFGPQLNLGSFSSGYGVGENTAVRYQTGTANFARVLQFGTGNVARQSQDGSQLASAIIQAGQSNRAETIQTGLLNQAAILQAGRENFATIEQRGNAGFALVSQTGLGNIAAIRQ